MNYSTLLGTVAVVSSLGLSGRLLAAQTPASGTESPKGGSQVAAPKPAEKCIAAVRSLTGEMSKRGYWLDGSDFGYGYPVGAYGYGYGDGIMTGGRAIGAGGGYAVARPGYEVRTLIAAANILARSGQETTCESVLASASSIYSTYAADLHDRGYAWSDPSRWRKNQINAAQPVTGNDVSFRSDQLLDESVVSPGNETLGSVHDLVTNPETGKIAYVIMSRGGLFGIDASYTPVPWGAFKATPNGSLLVLDTTKAVLTAAPQGRDDQFTKAGEFAAESQKVETYWIAHVKLASALK
jgi:hypothetical protein